jgi:hypothetical protein
MDCSRSKEEPICRVLNFKNEPLMSCRLKHFQYGKGENFIFKIFCQNSIRGSNSIHDDCFSFCFVAFIFSNIMLTPSSLRHIKQKQAAVYVLKTQYITQFRFFGRSTYLSPFTSLQHTRRHIHTFPSHFLHLSFKSF